MQRPEFSRNTSRASSAHGFLDLGLRLIRDLIGDEPRADLSRRSRWNHRLRSFTCKAAPNAVNLERRPRPKALKQRHARFSHQLARAHFLARVGGFIEWQTSP